MLFSLQTLVYLEPRFDCNHTHMVGVLTNKPNMEERDISKKEARAVAILSCPPPPFQIDIAKTDKTEWSDPFLV